MKMSVLGKLWLEEIAQSGRAAQTVDKYREAFETLVEPALEG